MTAELVLGGRFVWGGKKDDEGHRTFSISHLVKTNSVNDGPFVVMNCPGLPTGSAVWNFGNDNDVWASLYPGMEVEPHKQEPGHPHKLWLVTQKFGTRPIKRCQDSSVEDPLLEPQKVSGSFLKYTKEIRQDRFGRYIKSSSHELIRGPGVEFDANRPQVQISQNVPSLELDMLASMIDTVNDAPLWGLGARCVKLGEISWEKKYYGGCSVYFTRNLGYDIDFNGWDRVLIDEGTKALHGEMYQGEWVVKNFDPDGPGTGSSGFPPDPDNPSHFVRITDERGNVMRMILNGFGVPITAGNETGTGVGDNPGRILVEYYHEENQLLLGIPEDLEAP